MNNEIKDYIYEIQEEISKLVKNCNIKIKFVEKENLHISLKFLGELNLFEIEKIRSILKNIVTSFEQFTIDLAKTIRIFPNSLRPRVIWIGIDKGNDIIIKLYQSIENELKNEPFFQKENQFTSHITLARIKHLRYPKKLNEYVGNVQIDSHSQIVKKIDLMESKLTQKGPIYNIISSFPLSH